MTLGIDKTVEFLDAVEALVAEGGAVLEDGKINFKDVTHVPAILSAVKVMVADAKLSVDELKDLDKDELIAVVQKLFEVAEKVYEVFVPESWR